MAFFSIIIPIYNVKPYLDECLSSVEMQSFKDFEAILVNDGSNDGSREIAQKYASKDSRFILIDQENMGAGAARNTALSFITKSLGGGGRSNEGYILFLDSDDTFMPDLLEMLYASANKHPDILLLNYNLSDADGKITQTNASHLLRLFSIGPYETKDFLAINNRAPSLITTIIHFVIKKSFFATLNLSFPAQIYYEDVYFCTLLTAHAKQIYVSDICGYCYRQSPDSIMRGKMDLAKLNLSLHSYLFLIDHFSRLKDHRPAINTLYRRTALLCFKHLIRMVQRHGYTKDFSFKLTIPYWHILTPYWRIRHILALLLSLFKIKSF